jgi:hypothetical protein
MEPFSAPQGILTTESSDQRLYVWAERWTASFPLGFSPPPLVKGTVMALENRLGFH